MMWSTCLTCLFVLTLTWADKLCLKHEPLESLDIINSVNAANTTWKAGRNFHQSSKMLMINNLLSKKVKANIKLSSPQSVRRTLNLELPDEFDARTNWKQCSSIRTVQDQGPCPASWAVASASALTDRFCIAEDGFFQKPLSAEYILSCYGDGGCDGMYFVSSVWYHLMMNGLVTGGGYKSGKGCQPYSLPSCEHHVKGSKKNCYTYKNVTTPQCTTTCTNSNYKVDYDQDVYRAKTYFEIQEDVNQTQQDLYVGGPLVTCFDIYEDFLSYKSGVYQYMYGRNLGTTCAKIVGWGVENETPYWLAANTWNAHWGEKGHFKIRRGTNECAFESNIFGAVPDIAY